MANASPPPPASRFVNDAGPAAGMRFGRFLLLPAERQLFADGEALRPEPRAFDILVALATRAGELVSKDELFERIWPGRVVEEGNLHVQVSALRKLLGRQAIETVAGHGYRFTPAVHAADGRGSPAGGPGELPRQVASFVGRVEDLRTLEQAWTRTRLLTLTGMGGAGKTRLAIKLAERMEPGFAQGVRFVDLTPVADAARVASALAIAIGVREEAGRPIQQTLSRQLSDQRMLLVLDNCEHLLDASAALVQHLLSTCSALCVLATSRERLGIAGEQVVAVRPLSLPPDELSADPARLSEFESTRLFLDRARQAAPDFHVDAGKVAAIAEICRRLDGIPLALELAAARVALLSVEQIRANLDDRFRLLRGNARGPDRHQTLAASLQSSVDHLPDQEQRVFAQLSVFEGGWTLAAAAAVAGLGDDMDAVDSLGRLVDKSLVQVGADGGDGPRYSMLETVRQFARERLQASGDRQLAELRHRDLFLALARTAQARLSSDGMRLWFQRLDQELPNLLAAQARCSRLPDGAERGLELAASLRGYWLARGLFALGQDMFEQALQRTGAQARTALRGKTLYALGQHHYVSGRMDKAIAPLEEAYAIACEQGDDETAVFCLDKLGQAYAWQGEMARVQQAAERQLQLAERSGDPRLLGFALTASGHACRARGDFSAAAQAFERALALFESGQDANNRHNALIHVARANVSLGDLGRAGEALAVTLRLVGEMGVSYRGHFALDAGARLAAARGDFQRAARFQGAADAAMEKVGARPSWFDDDALAALRAAPRIALGDAGYLQAHADGHALTVEAALGELSGCLAQHADE